MTKKISLLILCIIIVLAAFLRIYNLSNIPPGVNQDEASIGYTAYSLLQTGMDEYQRYFPVSFQSFGDWKLPFYIYETMLSVKLFGFSEFAVRIPSAIAGIATVALTYLLILQISGKRNLALLTAFLIAFSPWHIHLSRVESESNTAVLFIVIGVFLLLKSLKGVSWVIVFSALSFALTYFIYAGNHIFTTLLLLGTVFIYRRKIPRNKWTAFGATLFFVLFSFIVYHTLFGADKTKLSGIGIFGDPSVVHAKIELPRMQHADPQSFVARLFHNKLVFGVERFVQNYLKSFSPEFLFIKGGDNRAHNIMNFGNMYLVEAIFFYFGMFYILFLKKKEREDKLVIWWLLISPIAASITKDAPHTNRMFAIFPILPFITALGIYTGIQTLDKYKKYKTLFIGIFVCVFAINIGMYFDRYFVHFPKNEAERWGIGYEALNKELASEKYVSKHVIISRPHYSPYIYLLFYQQYNPRNFQQSVRRYIPTSDGFVHVKSFDRYEFREIDWGTDLSKNNTLLVEVSLKVPDFVRNGVYEMSEITLPNGESMFTIIETK